MYVILFFLGVSLFQDLIFLQDSDMSSYIGFHSYKISSLFKDLASMNKTLSISGGLNSHACNGQDVSHKSNFAEESESQHNNTHRHSLSPSATMVYWGDDQNNELILAIKRGDIDPHNLDRTYLFVKTVQLFAGYEGDGTP